MGQVVTITKTAQGNVEFNDGTRTVAVLNATAHARPIQQQGIEITDATGTKIQVFANVLTSITSPTGGTVVAPITQQQLLGELATHFFQS